MISLHNVIKAVKFTFRHQMELLAKGQDVLLSAAKTGGRIGTTAEKTKQADADSHENFR